MKILDLFSGIGGLSLGLERAGMETVAFCEIDPFCQKVLKKHWPSIPIYDDIRKLNGEEIGSVDLICGGYPCQPFSLAGKREGEGDDRHLWPEYLRLIREIRPRWVIGENVAGHISMGLDDVLSDLEAEGYTWEAFVIPACAVDAKHRRDRIWIVAHHEKRSDWKHHTKQTERQEQESGKSAGATNVADTRQSRLAGAACGEFKELQGKAESSERGEPGRRTATTRGAWPTEPNVGRVANGIPRRVDRLRALGNAVVPQVVEVIGRALMELEK